MKIRIIAVKSLEKMNNKGKLLIEMTDDKKSGEQGIKTSMAFCKI